MERIELGEGGWWMVLGYGKKQSSRRGKQLQEKGKREEGETVK